MAEIIKNNPIQSAIENRVIEKEFRDYVGYSGIGSNCIRKLWYDYRHAYKSTITPRTKRLFDRGFAEEKIIIRDLTNAGIVVFDNQKEVVNEAYPQLKGHIDGLVKNLPGYKSDLIMLLEMKTANHSRFEKIKKQGLRKFDNAYWTQIQGYMSELLLDKCLFIVTNKNNDERIYVVYDYDPTSVTDIPYMIKDVVDSESIPMKIGNSIWWECKMCDAFKICHGADEIVKSCRNCIKGTITEKGVICNIHGYTDGIKCSSYKKLEVLK